MAILTLTHLFDLKERAEKGTCISLHEASFAAIASAAGVDLLFVGDSLGMTFQGHNSTIPVKIEEMVYHTQCVVRGNQGGTLVMADLPFMSYATLPQAYDNAARLMQAGANIVKLEGGAWLSDLIANLVERGIPVCGHLGLTPQSVHQLRGYKVQGRTLMQREQLTKDALSLQAAGASLLVLECVPQQLAQEISTQLTIPVIGIGAGPNCDMQVLVIHDLLGMSSYLPRFAKDFLRHQSDGVAGAIKAYIAAVKDKEFPGAEHSFN